jgi:hypothetical protein
MMMDPRKPVMSTDLYLRIDFAGFYDYLGSQAKGHVGMRRYRLSKLNDV